MCIDKCPENSSLYPTYDSNGKILSCEDCNKNCISCNDKISKCLKCTSGMIPDPLNLAQCYTLPCSDGCEICNAGTCQKCKTGILFEN